MTERSVTHATFTITRHYDASPARVFAAFAEKDRKAQWFSSHEGWTSQSYSFDFRTGGGEHLSITAADGVVHTFDARYQDIVPEERIVYSYDMHLNETRFSVSLATVEFKPGSKGTRLVFTEQGAFLDGHDNVGQRETGTQSLLDNLAASLAADEPAKRSA
ncbi:SRPBCC family protein [Pararhizobium sp. LjRoot238]|uniref:SRPBCC family protein n=1 Tax=Pararhizobium sp. LjRoot238 TaxID=3342293 RepID=UPI003ED16F97